MSGSEKEDVMKVVQALKDATRNLSKNSNNVETLLQGLKRLQKQELRDKGNLKDPKLRRKILSLYNLVSQLEPQVQQARKLANRKGIRYYLSRAKGKVLGNDISDVALLMEAELQSWLDLQTMDQLLQILQDENREEEEKIEALQQIKTRVQSGYKLELQDVILSTKAFDCVSALLRQDSYSSLRVKKEAAFTIAALVHFNRDVFVTHVLLSGVIERLLDMVESEANDVSTGAVAVLASLIVAGKAAMVDEIHEKAGVPKIVRLLDTDSSELKMAAVDCVLEMACYGRLAAIEAMLEADVIKKLARLELSEAGGQLTDLPLDSLSSDDSLSKGNGAASFSDSDETSTTKESRAKEFAQDNEECQDDHSRIEKNSPASHTVDYSKISSLSSDDSSQTHAESPQSTDDHHQKTKEYWEKHPFANVVAKFTMQLDMGQGLRNREKRALKQKIIPRIKEAIPSDAQVAAILAEVLWGP